MPLHDSQRARLQDTDFVSGNRDDLHTDTGLELRIARDHDFVHKTELLATATSYSVLRIDVFFFMPRAFAMTIGTRKASLHEIEAEIVSEASDGSSTRTTNGFSIQPVNSPMTTRVILMSIAA